MYCGRCEITRMEFSRSTGTNLTTPCSGPPAASLSPPPPPPAPPTIVSSSFTSSLALAVSSGSMAKLRPFSQSTSKVSTSWLTSATSCGVPAKISTGREASAFRMRSAGRNGCTILAISGAPMFLSGITWTPKPGARSAPAENRLNPDWLNPDWLNPDWLNPDWPGASASGTTA